MRKKLKVLLLLAALTLLNGAGLHAFPQERDTARISSGSAETIQEEEHEAENDDAYAEDDAEQEPQQRVVRYNSQTPSDARWLELVSDDDYNYRTTKEYVPQPEVKRERREPVILRWLQLLMFFFSSNAGQVILWIALVLIVGYIVFRIIAGEGGLFGRRDVKAVPATGADELSEEGLMELDWQARMNEALTKGERRQAIRFGYLHILQQLQFRELIRFRLDKTNISYYRELPEDLRPGFRELTRNYEFAWYGNFVPDDAGLQDYLNHREQFLQRVNRP